MSSILDALRKAHAQKEGGDKPRPEPVEGETEPGVPAQPAEGDAAHPRTDAPSRELPDSAPMQIQERAAQERPFEKAPVQEPWGDQVGDEPSAEEDADALPPPLAELPPVEEAVFLSATDDADRRRRLLRAGIVIAIGVVLGLALGNRFLQQTTTDEEDLLSDAVIRAKAERDAKEVRPGDTGDRVEKSAPAASAEPTPREGGKEPPPDRAGRSERTREGNKRGAKAAADSAPATAGAEAAAAAQQVREKPVMVPDPARAVPAAVPTGVPSQGEAPEVASAPAPVAVPPSPAEKAEQAKPASALPPSQQPPAASPAPEQTQPTPPAQLPALPDDAPQIALLFIQWSPEPARRVASLRQGGGTITIVHEGDVIQGLKVAVIRPTLLEMQWRGQSYAVLASRH